MKSLKSVVTLAGMIVASTVGGAALANHERWENWPPPESTSQRYVVPQQPVIVGYVASPPTYYYESAPRHYYAEPAPTHYYYQPAPVVTYYYSYDDSPFPRSNSRD